MAFFMGILVLVLCELSPGGAGDLRLHPESLFYVEEAFINA
jgi:hypothetical protein